MAIGPLKIRLDTLLLRASSWLCGPRQPTVVKKKKPSPAMDIIIIIIQVNNT
jgi:hypothetical protein